MAKAKGVRQWSEATLAIRAKQKAKKTKVKKTKK